MQTMDRCLPAYIVVDTSASMIPFEDELNDALEEVYGYLITNPRISDFVYISILSYNTDAKVVLKMADQQSVVAFPVLRCGGTTNLAKALRLLHGQIEEDIPRLSSGGRAVLRPVVFLLTDGLPTDDWKPDFASLTDKSYRRHPNIIPFGYGEATAGMLKEVSTVPGAAFQFQGGSTTDALQRSVPALLGTLTASAQVGELRLPAKVDGFVNVSLPEDHAQRQSSSGGVTGWKPVDPRRDWSPSSSRPVGPSEQTAAAGGEGGGGAGDPYAYDKVPPARRRYLKGQYPASVPLGRPFILLVSIVLEGPASGALKHFDVPPEGRDVLVAAHAPGLRLLGDQRLTVHVPHDGGSEPVMFELRADAPGPRSVSVTAWLGGSYLGELLIDITVERDRLAGPHREVLAEIATEPAEGAVSLVVRYDPIQKVYRFEFRDEDNPEEVTSNLAYEPGPLVEQLVAGLDDLAKGRSGLSGDEARSYLVESGAALWRELVPPQLREQFWDRQDRIGQLTILADKDAIPWELLYPMDPGHDAGFLVEQFWVTRAIFGRRPTRRLSLWPARFVLPGDSLPEARDEIDAMRLSLDPGQSPDEVISRLKPLQDLIAAGNFGLLHFACHNAYNPVGGSSIKLGNVQFTPTLMSTAAINKPLANSEPTVFINACRSAGLNATYNRLDGWASKFLDAGAAAFIGTLWAVSDGAAREFAQELYGRLQEGSSLGEAVKCAREAAASQPDDPTWLAYTV